MSKKDTPETRITKAVRSVLKTCGVFHWKQWQGPMSQPKGVSDLLGIRTVTITPEMVGMKVGIFTAIEMKQPGWKPPRPGTRAYDHYGNQKRFIDKIIRAGGVGFFAQSIDEVIDGLELRDRFLF